MTKRFFCLVLSLLVVCLYSGCSGETQATSTNEEVAETTEAVSETADAVSEQTQLETSQQSAASTIMSAAVNDTEADEKSVIWKAPNGELFYNEDAASYDGSVLAFDKALYRPSTGVFFDSFTDPEFFDPETHDFLGELIEYDESDWQTVQSGDTVNGHRVKKAETLFNISNEAYMREDGYLPLSNSILFEDEITLTGYLKYYPDDEPTLIQGGNLYFLPDSSYAGMPRVDFYPYSYVQSGKNYSDDTESNFLAVYSDSVSIYVGNLFSDYADNTTLNGMIENDEQVTRIKVEVTLGEFELLFCDMVIFNGANAKIISIKEIG